MDEHDDDVEPEVEEGEFDVEEFPISTMKTKILMGSKMKRNRRLIPISQRSDGC